MSRELGFRYRWNTPVEWLEEMHTDRHKVLHDYGVLDSDVIQNVDQNEMKEDGFFEPEAGVYLIDFEPEQETWDALNQAQWEADPLYQELTKLGCQFLGLRLPDTGQLGICVYIMVCPCPLATIAELGDVIDVVKAREGRIEHIMRDPHKRKLIEEAIR